MNPVLPNLVPMIPEIFILIMACVTLMLSAFLPKRRNLAYALVQITLVIVIALSWYIYADIDAANPVMLFDKSFILDKLAVVLKFFIYIITFMVFWYSRQYNEERRIPEHEFYVLGLLSVLGMMVLVSSHNFLVLYLGLELLSLPIYAMVALERGKARCIEAAMKYFVIGALASGILLYGLSMLFGATQSLDISQVARAIAVGGLSNNLMVVFGMVFVLSGIAFKLGAAPFHMWVPDVYDGAPTSATLFLSTAPKLAAFGLVIRLLVDSMPTLHIQWQAIWIVVALLSMGIGNLVAIMQSNIKRMLAYSSIAHMGYMILGLAAATPRGDTAALFYIISYSIMSLAGFGMITLMSRTGFEANNIEDFCGLNSRNPWLAFMMLLVMFSMAGIPPLLGFIAKVGVLEALIQVHLVWLAAIAMFFAVIGSYYYIRVVKVMYFEEPKHAEKIMLNKQMTIAISINSIAVLVMGVFPAWLFALSRIAF